MTNFTLTSDELSHVQHVSAVGWAEEWASWLSADDAETFFAELDGLKVGENVTCFDTWNFVRRQCGRW